MSECCGVGSYLWGELMREMRACGTLSTACMASRRALRAVWHALRLAATSSRSPIISSNKSSLQHLLLEVGHMCGPKGSNAHAHVGERGW